MTRMQTLQTLLEREQERRDQARNMLSQVQQQLDAGRRQAQVLDDYRGEYQARWQGQFAQGGAIEILRCYQGFIVRLDSAITQQGLQVQGLENALAQAMKRVQEREIRVATVERLISRHAAQLRAVAERREQKNMDEFAMRRRVSGGGLGMRLA